jgi:hypothetical protein
LTLLVETLNPVIAGVGDPEVAGGVDLDAHGIFELSIAGAFGAELGEIFAVGVELLDAVIFVATTRRW